MEQKYIYYNQILYIHMYKIMSNKTKFSIQKNKVLFICIAQILIVFFLEIDQLS